MPPWAAVPAVVVFLVLPVTRWGILGLVEVLRLRSLGVSVLVPARCCLVPLCESWQKTASKYVRRECSLKPTVELSVISILE